MPQLMVFESGRLVSQMVSQLSEFATREDYLQALEQKRRQAVWKRRAYYEGNQYDARNGECLAELQAAGSAADPSEKWLARQLTMWDAHLPEHLRLHEYSTQLMESVDFIANRLSGSASITVEDPAAAEVVQTCLDNSPELAGTEDEQNITLVNVIREALKVGDTPVLIRWDPVEGTCWLEFWDSEVVDMRFVDGRPDKPEKAIVEQVDWMVPPGETEEKAVSVRRVWSLKPRLGDLALTPRVECAEEVFLLDQTGTAEPVLVDTIWWGIPFLPWWLLRGDKKSLRAVRGESLITDQAMKTADRFNAVEQVSWLICRYNSHSTLAVMGDAALLQTKETKRIQKDVADILPFPGGTSAEVLSLPTDAQMIEHQKQVLLDGMYGAMGVTRVDQTSLEGLGGVTGYALEILNEKSGGTFRKVRSNLIRDWKTLLNLVLDAHAYWSQGTRLEEVAPDLLTALTLDAELAEPATDFNAIDPQAVFPNRAMEVVLGSGYVVDDTKIRDDFVAKLISQEEALRQRGKSDDEIRRIMAEQAGAQQRAMEVQAVAFGQTGTEATVRQPERKPPANKSSVGSTSASTARSA
jgi:hypothetical protein